MPKKGYKQTKEHKRKCAEHGFQKGNMVNLGKQNRLGQKNTKEQNEKIGKANSIALKGCTLSEQHKKKIGTSKIGHHIWYEDNEGNPTDKGIWFIKHGYHAKIHAVLRHNHWTDNRRYLAG